MNDSSVPFRAFLGAILSVVEGEDVEASTFDDDQTLDTIVEEEGPSDPSGSNHNSDSNNGSGGYEDRPSKGKVGHRSVPRSMTRSEAGALMVRPSCAPFISMGRLKFFSIDFVILPTVS
jgi:hypothetical protein